MSHCESGRNSRVVVMFAALLTVGCACVERLKAQELSREHRVRSIERSTGTMQKVAARLGATLLPERVQSWHEPWQCSSKSLFGTVACEPWWALAVAPVGRVEDPTGKWRQVIPVGDHGTLEYLRVARRGDTIFLLVPHLQRRAVQNGSACSCDGGPVIVRNESHAFVLDDLPVKQVERVMVPVTEDYIEWECRMILVENERSLRQVAASQRVPGCE